MTLNIKSLHSWRSLPLLLAYIAYPAVDMALRAAGQDTFGSWIRAWIDGAWIVLLIAGALTLLFRLDRPVRLPKCPLLTIVALGGCAAITGAGVLLTRTSVVSLAMELKPLCYALVAFVWAAAFGLPRTRAFVKAGLILSLLIGGELLIRSVFSGEIVHPTGSGEVNYDACLIALSLCCALSDEHVPAYKSALLFIGILSTFSRTGAISALAIVFLSRRVSKTTKALASLPAALAIFLSFESRALDFAVSHIDRYIMWAAAVQLFERHPAGLLFGYGLGNRLPVDAPAGLSTLWNSQADRLDLSGIFAFQFHAMWLRLIISWGGFVVLGILLVLLRWILQKRVPISRYLGILIISEAFTMGMFYLSNVAVPAFLLTAIAANSLYARPNSLSLNHALPSE